MTDAKVTLPEGYKPGLEGVVAGTSAISEVDATRDALTYRGYAAHELAEKSTFEDVAYLLLFGTLPNKAQLDKFKADLNAERGVPERVLNHLKDLPSSAHTMVMMRSAVSLLHMEDPDGDKTDLESNTRKAIRLIAKSSAIVAAISRIKEKKELIPHNPKLSHSADFLYMTLGKEPGAEVERIFESTSILYTEHGFNASTFAALVTASTLSDMHSAVASAIGTLKGPLHGGANEAAIEMLLKIKSLDDVEGWLKEALARKEKIMGFGHRVYKRQDSRAPMMKVLAETMAKRAGDKKIFPISVKLEDVIKQEKGLFPNVDYHCAVAYYLMGLPVQIYTAIFAMFRMVGWTAHVLEQHSANRLIRPACIYTGARGLSFIPVEKRG